MKTPKPLPKPIAPKPLKPLPLVPKLLPSEIASVAVRNAERLEADLKEVRDAAIRRAQAELTRLKAVRPDGSSPQLVEARPEGQNYYGVAPIQDYAVHSAAMYKRDREWLGLDLAWKPGMPAPLNHEQHVARWKTKMEEFRAEKLGLGKKIQASAVEEGTKVDLAHKHRIG